MKYQMVKLSNGEDIICKVENELVLQTASEFYKTCRQGVVVKHEEENDLTEQGNTNQPF